MELKEQLYKNLNRKYYHGSYCGKLKENFLIYLTNSFVYAVMFACQVDNQEGKVFELRPKDGLDIFNAKSRKDIMQLKLYAKKNNLQLDKDWYWKGLDSEDWTFLFRNTNLKNTCIDAFKDLGYDGFFNYEWTANKRENLKKEREFKGQFVETSPAICVFNSSSLKEISVYQYKDYFQFQDFVKIYEKEKQLLKDFAGTLYFNRKETDISSYLLTYAQDHVLFLTGKDLEDILKNLPNYVQGKDFKVLQTLDECLKRGVSRDGNYRLDGDLQVCPVRKVSIDKGFEKAYRRTNRELGIKDLIFDYH